MATRQQQRITRTSANQQRSSIPHIPIPIPGSAPPSTNTNGEGRGIRRGGPGVEEREPKRARTERSVPAPPKPRQTQQTALYSGNGAGTSRQPQSNSNSSAATRKPSQPVPQRPKTRPAVTTKPAPRPQTPAPLVTTHIDLMVSENEDDFVLLESRRFGSILISMETVRYMNEAEISARDWQGRVRQFWSQTTLLSFHIPGFKEKEADKMFQILCPKHLTHKLAKQTRKLKNYFNAQYTDVTDTLRANAQRFGTEWMKSPAGQHLEELSDNSKEGEFDFELPGSAQDLFNWDGYKGIEFTKAHLVDFLGRFLKYMELEATSDGLMGWLADDPDCFWVDHMMNKVCRLIICWVVTDGLYGNKARYEACLEAADEMLELSDEYMEQVPPMRKVSDPSAFFNDKRIHPGPSIDVEGQPTDQHVYTKEALEEPMVQKADYPDADEVFGFGDNENPMTAIDLGPMAPQHEERDESELSDNLFNGGLHPMNEHCQAETDAINSHNRFGDEDLQLMAARIPNILEKAHQHACEVERHRLNSMVNRLEIDSIDHGIVVEDEVAHMSNGIIKISEQPFSMPRSALAHAFAASNIFGQMYIMRARCNFRLRVLSERKTKLEDEMQEIEKMRMELDQEEAVQFRITKSIDALYHGIQQGEADIDRRREAIEQSKSFDSILPTSSSNGCRNPNANPSPYVNPRFQKADGPYRSRQVYNSPAPAPPQMQYSKLRSDSYRDSPKSLTGFRAGTIVSNGSGHPNSNSNGSQSPTLVRSPVKARSPVKPPNQQGPLVGRSGISFATRKVGPVVGVSPARSASHPSDHDREGFLNHNEADDQDGGNECVSEYSPFGADHTEEYDRETVSGEPFQGAFTDEPSQEIPTASDADHEVESRGEKATETFVPSAPNFKKHGASMGSG